MEMGSPIPRWRRPSLEEQQILEETPQEGRPMIRLTPCPTSSGQLTVPSLGINGAQGKGLSPTLITNKYTPLEPIKTRVTSQESLKNIKKH